MRNRIEPLASTPSVERTPRKMQSTELTPSMTARENWLLTTEDTEEDIRKQTKPAEGATDLECAGRVKRRRRFGLHDQKTHPKRCRATTTPARLPRRGPRCLPPRSIFCRPLRGLDYLIGGLVPGAYAPGNLGLTPQALCWRLLRRLGSGFMLVSRGNIWRRNIWSGLRFCESAQRTHGMTSS